MTLSTIGLIASLILNICQYVESFYKTKREQDLKEKQLKISSNEQKANRIHELKKLELEEDIHRSRLFIPEARKACIEYIGITEAELSQATGFPVTFSKRQQILEAKVMLYLPDSAKSIESFKSTNSPTSMGITVPFLKKMFESDIISSLAKQLQTFQSERK